jgi:hypothetical protein
VATAGYGAVDGMKHVDSAEVFSILEKVLGTVMLRIPARGASQFAVNPRVRDCSTRFAVQQRSGLMECRRSAG